MTISISSKGTARASGLGLSPIAEEPQSATRDTSIISATLSSLTSSPEQSGSSQVPKVSTLEHPRHFLPQYGFGTKQKFSELVQDNPFLFRVYTPRDRRVQPSENGTEPRRYAGFPFDSEPYEAHFRPRTLSEPSQPVTPMLTPPPTPDKLYSLAKAHLDWTSRAQGESPFVRASFSFAFSIWEAWTRYREDLKGDIEIAIIDARRLAEKTEGDSEESNCAFQAFTCIEMLGNAKEEERRSSDSYWSWYRYALQAQDVLVWGGIPRDAILASIPLLELIQSFPDYFLRDGALEDIEAIDSQISDRSKLNIQSLAWPPASNKSHLSLSDIEADVMSGAETDTSVRSAPSRTRKTKPASHKYKFKHLCALLSARFLRIPMESRERKCAEDAVRLAVGMLSPWIDARLCEADGWDDHNLADAESDDSAPRTDEPTTAQDPYLNEVLCSLAASVARWPASWYTRDHPNIIALVEELVQGELAKSLEKGRERRRTINTKYATRAALTPLESLDPARSQEDIITMTDRPDSYAQTVRVAQRPLLESRLTKLGANLPPLPLTPDISDAESLVSDEQDSGGSFRPGRSAMYTRHKRRPNSQSRSVSRTRRRLSTFGSLSGGEEDLVPAPPRLRPRVVSWASVASDSTLADDDAYNEHFSSSDKPSHSNMGIKSVPPESPGRRKLLQADLDVVEINLGSGTVTPAEPSIDTQETYSSTPLRPAAAGTQMAVGRLQPKSLSSAAQDLLDSEASSSENFDDTRPKLVAPESSEKPAVTAEELHQEAIKSPDQISGSEKAVVVDISVAGSSVKLEQEQPMESATQEPELELEPPPRADKVETSTDGTQTPVEHKDFVYFSSLLNNLSSRRHSVDLWQVSASALRSTWEHVGKHDHVATAAMMTLGFAVGVGFTLVVLAVDHSRKQEIAHWLT